MIDQATQTAAECVIYPFSGLLNCTSSEDARNIGLIILGAVGIYFAYQRTTIAHNSADMDRFQKGAQMLGDDRLSVRQAGVIIFEELAKENPKRFALMCQKTLEQFILDRGREDIKEFDDPFDENTPNISADAQSALGVMIEISQMNDKKGEKYGKRVELPNAHLKGAVLRKANLQGADLGFVNLQGAELVPAKLQRASLLGANLQGARLVRAELQGAKLQGANLQGAKLVHAELQGAKLQGANLQGAELVHARLQDAKLQGANLQGAELVHAEFKGAILQGGKIYGAESAEFESPALSKWCLDNNIEQSAGLHGTYVPGADLKDADLHGVNFENAEVTWAQLDQAKNIDRAKNLPPRESDVATDEPSEN